MVSSLCSTSDVTDFAIDRGNLSASGFNRFIPWKKKALVAIVNGALGNIILLLLLGINSHYLLCPYHGENINCVTPVSTLLTTKCVVLVVLMRIKPWCTTFDAAVFAVHTVANKTSS